MTTPEANANPHGATRVDKVEQESRSFRGQESEPHPTSDQSGTGGGFDPEAETKSEQHPFGAETLVNLFAQQAV